MKLGKCVSLCHSKEIEVHVIKRKAVHEKRKVEKWKWKISPKTQKKTPNQ